MKDECKTMIITEFVALNPKVYTVNTLSYANRIDNFKKLKGVSEVVVNKK